MISACLILLGASIGALWQPFYLLAIGPILLGPAHIASDIKYLAIPRWRNKKVFWILSSLTALAAFCFNNPILYLLPLFCIPWLYRISTSKKLLLLLLPLCITASFYFFQNKAQLVLVYLHNVIALLIWALWQSNKKLRITVTVFFLLISLTLVTGLFEPLLTYPDHQIINEKLFSELAFNLYWGLDPVRACRWATLFIFWQLCHYGIWLNLIPQTVPLNSKPPKARKTLFVGTIVATLFFSLLALTNIWESRLLYLQLASFHVYLELLFLMMMFCERGQSDVH